MGVQVRTGRERKNKMPKIVVVNLTDESVEQYEADGREYGRGLAVSLLE